MGVSTNAQICYGIAFDEEFEFPWSECDDIEDWWVFNVLGFKHAVEIYTPEGEYIDGVKPAADVINKYYADIRAFRDAHPMPIKLVTHCSGDYPMYILAVPGSRITCSRGDWVELDPAALTVTQEEHNRLVHFCEEFSIVVDNTPRWLLTSYWG